MSLNGVPSWQIALFACNSLAFLAVLARILFSGLVKSYPALTVWVGVNVIVTSLPWIVRMDWLTYHWFYIAAEGLTLVLYLLTVLELYGIVLRKLTGIATVARKVIGVVVPASATGAATLLAFQGRPYSYLDWLYSIDQTVIASLILFVFMITAFIVWVPIGVARNTVVYSIGYAAYLVPKGATLFLRNSGHGVAWMTSGVGMTVSALCLLFWAVALSRSGETVLVSIGRRLHHTDEERVLAQLDAINRALLRASGK